MTEVHALNNGIAVLLSPDARAETACVLVGVAVGANHEADHEHGLAHFFEHMCFKGTRTYSDTVSLVTRMEESGLVANAYTDREYTGYHLSGRSEKVGDMVAITADIFLHSLFPERELDKEKQVIVEEIAMYNDDPASKAFDVVDQSLFHGTAAEHRVLGTVASVRSFSRDDFMRFLEKHYVTGNMIISISGNFDRDSVLRDLERVYAEAKVGKGGDQVVVSPRSVSASHTSVVRSDLEQTHVVFGGYAPSYLSDDRYAAEVFDVVIGGSMSSRLFLRVREKLGACYTIKSYLQLMTHAGGFSVHTGIAGDRAEEVLAAVADECVLLRTTPVGAPELQKAKEFLLGLHAIRQESTHAIATDQMHAYAQSGAVEDSEAYEKGILAVTSADVQRVARSVFVAEKLGVCYVSNRAVPSSVTEGFLAHLRVDKIG